MILVLLFIRLGADQISEGCTGCAAAAPDSPAIRVISGPLCTKAL